MYAEDEVELIKENEETVKEYLELKARLEAMYEWMKVFEYCDYWRCPACDYTRKNGHSEECSLASELAATEKLLGIGEG